MTASEVIPPTYQVTLGDLPKKVTCLYCHEPTETEVEYKVGSQSIIMSCVTMPCLLCWVPLVLDRFKDAKHKCSKCESPLGMTIRF